MTFAAKSYVYSEVNPIVFSKTYSQGMNLLPYCPLSFFPFFLIMVMGWGKAAIVYTIILISPVSL